MNGDMRNVEKMVADLDGSVGCVFGGILILCAILLIGLFCLYTALLRIADKL